ncbi:polymorphic toxin-type HINT domain-containing protein [Streptomyces niveus]|uniref:polymorphic toxin-type HINT domain-containing protein n=1 Tax=Streptomyces niveus TaxID=193462 RepID=UPI003627740B
MTESPPTQGAEPGPPPATPPPPGHPPRQIRGAGFRRLQELTGRRRLVLLSGVSALVLALVAGLLALDHDSGSDAQQARTERNLQPFKEAIEDLADAPGLRYQDTSTLGITENDITVTAGGSQFGTTASGRNDHGRDVLRIDGKKFTRWQVDPAPGKDVAPGKKAPPSEWIVGLDDGSKLMDEALARTIAPSKLAAVLDKALADLERSPPPDGSKTSSTSGQRPLNVNGTPALAVDTSAGRLLVTKDKPHRVLRLEAYDLRENLSDLRDQLENGEEPTAPRTVTTGPLAAGGAEGMDLTPILADAADKMLDTLVEYADQLKDATDRGITFTLDGAGEMDCSPKGCTATQNFTGKVSSIARKERVTQGEVTAVLSATFTIDGKPAGQCTSPQRTFPVRGNNVSGTLKCSNPAAGPLYASVAARVQAQAQADADACGCRVRLTYPLRANTLIDARALATVEAEKLANQAKSERDRADCTSPHSFPSGTQVLLADGTTRAIEDIRIGDRVAASDPHAGLTVTRPVTNTFTSKGDKDFTRLTVAARGGPATIAATDTHPFWLADQHRWADAVDISVGDDLRTPSGAQLRVTGVSHYTRQQTTHDLTISGVRTYYVGIGAASALVHNKGCVDQELLEEMKKKGVKFDPEKVVRAERDADGRIVFLEKGNSRAGLQHILEEHADDFKKAGVTRQEIADLVMAAVTKGKKVGTQGKGDGRPVYEVEFKGNERRVAVTVGSNGFVVGANPKSMG